MGISNPFQVDAASTSEQELAQLPPQGGVAIRGFCGLDELAKNWDERGVCVLKARKGLGKSHLLKSRSSNHRDSADANRTIFYPQGGHPRPLIDALSSLHVVVPRWLQGKEAAAAWMNVWQLSILGLMVWITGARSATLRGYADWFGSLEQLDEVQRQNQPNAPEGGQPNVMLTWFMGRILERKLVDDYVAGTDALKRGLYYGESDWAIAITSSLAKISKTKIAMYLDAPDELVELDSPNLWRNVQQGLLLAIWKFSKNTRWSTVLNIYATVRSEAFGSGQDHPNVAQAMDLVLPLLYSRDELEAMLNDRIRQAEPSRLSRPLKGELKPIHALCGFSVVTHANRSAPGGVGRFTEDVFDSILRHTRRVPREVIGIAGAIYSIVGPRSFLTVRQAVNAQAGADFGYAIKHSFLGWSELLHGRFAVSLHKEVIDAQAMADLAGEFGQEGPGIIKLFVKHGILGTAENSPQRHRHYYRQRFAFDEVHGHEDSSSVSKDYFFVHPAFKEWIRSLPERLNKQFDRLESGPIGDLMPFEAMPPILRLGLDGGEVFIKLRPDDRALTPEKGVTSDPLRLLFAALCTCREMKQARIDITELMRIWSKLGSISQITSAVRVALPNQTEVLAGKLRDWAKKINKDRDIKQLQRLLMGVDKTGTTFAKRRTKAIAPSKPFMSVSARSDIGARVEIWFSHLPIDELDYDEELYKLIGSEYKVAL